MRRSVQQRHRWARYRLNNDMPKVDGPPPVSSPQKLNDTKSFVLHDPINDPFPRSIRGSNVRPDVPDRHYTAQWYFINAAQINELTPWSAEAPEGAFRFRPFNEFDKTGRAHVRADRTTSRLQRPSGAYRTNQRGAASAPMREAYLTRMNTDRAAASNAPSMCTVMDRASTQQRQRRAHQTPLQVQRDVGRNEAPLAIAGNVEVDKAKFPYAWKTDDWYEYEVAKVRQKRFLYENEPGKGLAASEVTYKLVLTTLWEHHAEHLAEDLCAFFRDIGRQVIEEKLLAVRKMLATYSTTASAVTSVDPETRAAFGLAGDYDDDEVLQFVRRELLELEEQCVRVLNLTNAAASQHTDRNDPNASWPHVEQLEPWLRMTEFWSQKADNMFADAEMSTRKYEFRRFYRVVKIKMPFQSDDFERRMYDVRHWLHRHASVEFHTVHRKNVVHDGALFPVERDPMVAPTHEHHRMFSYALDWQSSPANHVATETTRPDDTWASVAERLGTTEKELHRSNPDAAEKLAAGATLRVPLSATKRLTSHSAIPQSIPVNGDSQRTTWEHAAEALGCTAEELQVANAAVCATYKDGFDAATTSLQIPSTVADAIAEETFSRTEPTFENDTFESVASRLGATVAALKEANEGVAAVADVSELVVPASALRPRRVNHPQLRTEAATQALFPTMTGDVHRENLPATLPSQPANAAMFPGEFAEAVGTFPVQPAPLKSEDNWLSYTATYLDRDLSVKNEAAPVYNTNRLWPVQAIPGSPQQTPFEEDQTWLMHRIPLQMKEQFRPEQHVSDLPQINHEQFAQSMDWLAP